MRVERARYFEAAARLGSLRAAAEELGVSQPALGQQVELLEEELDVVLLTRSRRGVAPTAAGQALLVRVQELILAEDVLRDEARALTGTYRGTVRIGCIPILVGTLVAPLVGDLLRRHPTLRFTVTESSSDEAERRVGEGHLDFGLVTEPTAPAAENLRRDRLFSVSLYACVPAGHPLADRVTMRWADLEPWPIVSMRPGTRLWETLHAHVPGPRVVFETGSSQAIRSLVAYGAGIGIVSLVDPREQHTDARLRRIPIVDGEHSIPVCLTRRRDVQHSRSATAVKRLVLAEVRRMREIGAVEP